MNSATLFSIALLLTVSLSFAVPSFATEAPPCPPASDNHLTVGNGHRIWFQDSGGCGDPVLFVHARSGSALMWRKQTSAFRHAGYRTIAYSRRGHYPSVAGDPDVPGIGSLDLHKLMSHLSLGPTHLVATAWGGVIATDFINAYPQRVRSAVLANTIFGIANTDYRDQLARLMTPEFRRLPTAFKELGPSYRHRDPAGVQAWEALSNRSVTFKLALEEMQHDVTWEDLTTWSLPVLLITGDADLYMPATLITQVQDRISGSKLEVIGNTGHSAYWEATDRFNALVLEFLESH